jgi:hypothetical protein
MGFAPRRLQDVLPQGQLARLEAHIAYTQAAMYRSSSFQGIVIMSPSGETVYHLMYDAEKRTLYILRTRMSDHFRIISGRFAMYMEWLSTQDGSGVCGAWDQAGRTLDQYGCDSLSACITRVNADRLPCTFDKQYLKP